MRQLGLLGERFDGGFGDRQLALIPEPKPSELDLEFGKVHARAAIAKARGK